MCALDSLDIESAIASHTSWYRQFEQAILGIDAEKLSLLNVADDTQCVLGCWLHGPAKLAYGDLPLYLEIVSAHRDFHWDAQHIVSMLLHGDVEQAELYLHTLFKETSVRLVALLNELSSTEQKIRVEELGAGGTAPR